MNLSSTQRKQLKILAFTASDCLEKKDFRSALERIDWALRVVIDERDVQIMLKRMQASVLAEFDQSDEALMSLGGMQPVKRPPAVMETRSGKKIPENFLNVYHRPNFLSCSQPEYKPLDAIDLLD